MEALFAGIIAAIIGGITGIVTNAKNRRAVEQSNEMNKNMNLQSMMYQSMENDKANAYNSPKAQIQRNMEAGINPLNALEMNQSNAPSSPSLTPDQPAVANPIDTSSFSEIANVLQAKRAQDMDMVKAFLQNEQFTKSFNHQKSMDFLGYILNANNSAYDNAVKVAAISKTQAEIDNMAQAIDLQKQQLEEMKKQNAAQNEIQTVQNEINQKEQTRKHMEMLLDFWNNKKNRDLDREEFDWMKEHYWYDKGFGAIGSITERSVRRGR